MTKFALLALGLFLPLLLQAEEDSMPVPPYPASVSPSTSGQMTVGVTFSDTGHVAKVKIVRSSGSSALDSSTEQFIQDHWVLSMHTLKTLRPVSGGYYSEAPINFIGSKKGPPPPLMAKYQEKMNSAILDSFQKETFSGSRGGDVGIKITVYSDGHVTTSVVDSDPPPSRVGSEAAIDAIKNAAPFDPFSEDMKKEVAKSEGNDGNSFTEVHQFNIPKS